MSISVKSSYFLRLPMREDFTGYLSYYSYYSYCYYPWIPCDGSFVLGITLGSCTTESLIEDSCFELGGYCLWSF